MGIGETNCCTARVFLLNGVPIQRRFLNTETLQTIMYYIKSHDLNLDKLGIDYNLISNYPRKIWNDPTMVLKDMKLGKRILLHVEEIHSDSDEGDESDEKDTP